MHVTPAGFTFLPGAERDGGAVFPVHKAGTAYVCKRLPPRARGEAWARARLAAEGRLLGSLDGRGAPRLVAAGEDGHGPWLVMERVDWPALEAHAGAVDSEWLGRAAGAVLEALAAVHAAGVVHADLSPQNVLVASDGREAVIVDFGLALAPAMPPMPEGPFRGTLAYAAPEVARGEPFDGRADLFSAAASLLRVACGHPPRAHATPAAMLLAAGEEPVTPWAERAARGLSPAAARALVGCCEHDAGRRPASAAQVASALGARRGLP